jgi:rare lipoprotein A
VREAAITDTGKIGMLSLALTPVASQAVEAGQVGVASKFCELAETASGKSYSCEALVAAHRTLPFGTRVSVKNLANGKRVTVTIVDRGPFVKGRIIDLSEGAARPIGSADLMKVEISAQ